ncbi:MAG TPA: hypothetical protein ENJ82_07115 [Bacteroidetes bacterium]|nr:hypothetical protein [Bacteroidota bacterium]
MKIFVFGNGNLSFEEFQEHYQQKMDKWLDDSQVSYVVCDFRGVDTLVMEYLKCKTPHVSVLHMMDRPRYLPDKYKTKVSQWEIRGGFETDADRDAAAIEMCSHFLAIDFNSNSKRISGTQKNIDRCRELGKTEL